jgi:DUF1365 family protein
MRDVSALYTGIVTHERFAPRRHRLRYRLWQLLLDLDEAPDASRRLKLFSYNRFNVFSHHDRDHGDGRPGPLRGYIEETLAAAGLEIKGGAIQLLCMPRLFGHVFNPLSIYYCYRPDGGLAAMLYEVNNTFGQRHSYLILADPAQDGTVHQTCAKAFHVSPFMDMRLRYDFQVSAPGETITTTIHGSDPQGALIIAAAFCGRRRALTDGALARALVDFPLMTLKVVVAIHWEAVKLWLKGTPLKPVPPAPAGPITVVRPEIPRLLTGTPS